MAGILKLIPSLHDSSLLKKSKEAMHAWDRPRHFFEATAPNVPFQARKVADTHLPALYRAMMFAA